MNIHVHKSVSMFLVILSGKILFDFDNNKQPDLGLKYLWFVQYL